MYPEEITFANRPEMHKAAGYCPEQAILHQHNH